MIKAIIFDMDGVLFDSHDAWIKVFNKARENFGFKPISVEEFDKNCWAVDSSIIGPKYFPGKTIEEVTNYYNKIFFEFIDDVKLTPKVKETLTKLKNTNLRLAIATNTYQKQAEKVLKELNLFDFFETVAGADSVEKGKPAPDLILEVFRRLRLSKNEIYFVGDHDIDIKTCHNAGCQTIGFKIDGDKRIDEFRDLLRLIEH